jgi:uncharacterized protein DUF6788
MMKHKEALLQRVKLAANLPPLTEILRGSLLHRIIRHKKGCPKCAQGGGHAAWILTIGYPGKVNRQFSIRPDLVPQVKRWLQNHHKLKARLEAICELNHTFLRPEE